MHGQLHLVPHCRTLSFHSVIVLPHTWYLSFKSKHLKRQDLELEFKIRTCKIAQGYFVCRRSHKAVESQRSGQQ